MIAGLIEGGSEFELINIIRADCRVYARYGPIIPPLLKIRLTETEHAGTDTTLYASCCKVR